MSVSGEFGDAHMHLIANVGLEQWLRVLGVQWDHWAWSPYLAMDELCDLGKLSNTHSPNL